MPGEARPEWPAGPPARGRYSPSSDQSPGPWKSLPAVTIRPNSRTRINTVPTCSAGCRPLQTSSAWPPAAMKVGHQAPALGAGEIVLVGVRQADPGAGRAQGADGVGEGRPVLLDVSQLAGAQPLAEGFGAILDPAALEQEFGEVRARRRVAAVAQLRLDRPRTLQGTGHALGLQAPADLLGARSSGRGAGRPAPSPAARPSRSKP